MKCPKCNANVEIEPFKDYNCPKCSYPGMWEKVYSEDYSNSWNEWTWDIMYIGNAPKYEIGEKVNFSDTIKILMKLFAQDWHGTMFELV